MIFELKKAAKQLLFNSKKLKATDTQGAIEEVAEGMIYGEVKTGEMARNAANSVLPEVTVCGKSVQAGEPTPDKPVDIVSVGKALSVVSCGKNWFNNTAITYTFNGITFTVNVDKSITANGTASDNSTYTIGTVGKLGEIKLIGSPKNANKSYLAILKNKSWSNAIAENGNGIITTLTDDVNSVVIAVPKGETVSNMVFKPMITSDLNATYDDYEPYISTQASITLADDLRGIPVTEGGNYTDANGQQWICDTVEKYADGTGLWTKRVYSEPITDVERVGNSYIQYGAEAIVYLSRNIRKVDTEAVIMSNKALGVPYNKRGSMAGGQDDIYRVYCVELDYVTFRYPASVGEITLEQAKTDLVGGEVVYALAEPMTASLSADQVSAFELLHSFDPYTTVMTDDIGDVRATYLVNTAAGQAMGNHAHDNIYYRKETINGMLSSKSPMVHTHDDRYYQKSETYTKDEVNQQLGYKVSQADFAEHKANFLTTKTFTGSLNSGSPNVMVEGSIDVTLTGYTPIGVVSYDTEATIVVSKLRVVNNTVEHATYNCGDTELNLPSIEVTVLYVKK